MKAAGINAHYCVSPETAHEWLLWRRSLKEMTPLLFNESPGATTKSLWEGGSAFSVAAISPVIPGVAGISPIGSIPASRAKPNRKRHENADDQNEENQYAPIVVVDSRLVCVAPCNAAESEQVHQVQFFHRL